MVYKTFDNDRSYKVGDKKGKLLILEILKDEVSGKKTYLCKCECGNDFMASHSRFVATNGKQCRDCFNNHIIHDKKVQSAKRQIVSS